MKIPMSSGHTLTQRNARSVSEPSLPPAPQILVVDDEKSQRSLICKSLEAVGYQALATATGTEALRILSQRQTDLVLLDIIMPDMNGFVTCSEIRKLSDVPIIMLSSLADDDNIAHGLDIGADDYLVKPCISIELHARIFALLRRTAWTQWDSLDVQFTEQRQPRDETAQHLRAKVAVDPRNLCRTVPDHCAGHKVIPNL